MQEMWVHSLGQEDPLEKEMATRSRILAWEIPWTEEPGGLKSEGSQRVGLDLGTKQATTLTLYSIEIKCRGKASLLLIQHKQGKRIEGA